ncbi:MAG TPA: ABC transporter permease [Gemmatimonadaceae bacterium]
MIDDIRYALRQLRRAPAFTTTSVLTLAVGIAANVALFTLMNAILLRPVPGVRNDGRLTWFMPASTIGGRLLPISYPDFRDYRDQAGVFEQAAAFAGTELSLSDGGEPTRVRGQIVSGRYFSALGVQMTMGRGFTPDEDDPATPRPVVVISHRLWQERFEADGSVLGRTIAVDGVRCTIVGVAPDRFNGPDVGDQRVDLWVPLAMQPRVAPQSSLADRNAWWLSAFGRLKPGVSITQARAAVAAVAARLAVADSAGHAQMTATVFAMRGGIEPADIRTIVPVSILASAATGLILLICCANVGNMLLSRAIGRRREIGVRLSLGATRTRIARQLLTESMLLAAVASVVGLLLATWATELLASTLVPTIDVSPETHTIAFTVIVAAFAAVLFGMLPALHATRGDLASALKAGTLGVDKRRSRLQGGFVIAQVSLSLVLLTTSGMFLDGLYQAARVDLGFDASSHVLAASVDLGMQGYTSRQTATFVRTIRTQGAALPGATDVSVTTDVPLGERRSFTDIALDDKESDQQHRFGQRGMEVYGNAVAPGFFHTLGVRLISGRDFGSDDVDGAPSVAIVSRDFADRAWPRQDALGKHVSTSGAKGPFLTVIGVAQSARVFGIGERARPIVYRPLAQTPNARALTLLVRSAGDATTLAPAIRRMIHAVDPGLPVYEMQSLGQYRRERLASIALGSTLLGTIGALSVLLASVGLYAVVAFSVGQRTREIGIRIALGAARQRVVRLFVAEGVRLATIGLVAGLGLSMGLTRVVAAAFLGVASNHVATFALIAALVTGVTILASWIPARRAAGVDPMAALRSE